MTAFEIDELRRTYHLLEVPYSASERSIKQAYWRITKRWHPDRYASGTPAYTEATQMMKVINEAYSQIASAPLRYYDEQSAAPRRQTDSEVHRSSDPDADKRYAHKPYVGNPYSNDLYVTDVGERPGRLGRRMGACFRFVAGGVYVGWLFWYVYVSLRLAGYPVLAIVVLVGAFLGGGFAMARYGKDIRWGRW